MKVLILASFDRSLVSFRGSFIQELKRCGHEVVAAAPAETASTPAALAALGASFVPIELNRTGLNPLGDLFAYFRLRRLIGRERPDVVISYTIKPVIYGSLAASAAGVGRIYVIITGLGTMFFLTGAKARLIQRSILFLYRRALGACGKVFAQNYDIADFFVRRNIVSRDKIVLVRGSGVDLNHFQFRPQPSGPPVFLFLGRLLRDKGVFELVAAAQDARSVRPDIRVKLVGDIDTNPTSVSLQDVHRWQRQGIIEYYPACDDVRPHLEECSACVLPSYHEGMPRSVLEAMATGRAIITTDAIGCRETVRIPSGNVADSHGVRQGENGFLVPVKSSSSLAAAMLRLAQDPKLLVGMGRRAREIAEQEFDVRQVNQAMVVAMEL